MHRALSLHLPQWSVDLIRRKRGEVREKPPEAGAPILLIAAQHGAQVVVHGCEHAQRAGVQAGMTLAHARALLEGPGRIEPFEPQRDEQALGRLAAWALRYSPLVAPDPPDGLLLDITGCARAFGGEMRLIHLLWRDVRRLGFSACLAAASTFGCAHALSRFGNQCCSAVPPGQERAALGPLPVEALRIDEAIVAALHEVEITRLEHVLAVPRAQLGARFGLDLLRRMDQALGLAPEALKPVRYQPPLEVERIFDGPTTRLEAIEGAVEELIAELCAILLRREAGVRRLELRLKRIDAEPVSEIIMLSSPNRNPGHLWALLRPRLERINLGYGVEEVMLKAARVGKLRHEQIKHAAIETGSDAKSNDLATGGGELIDTLASRLGAQRVVQAEIVESHLPEASFQYRPTMEERSRAKNAAESGLTRADRPTTLLERPEAVQVAAEDGGGLPLRVHWRGMECAVMACFGPERISPEWWRGDRFAPGAKPATRDYYKVRDDAGRLLWMFREPANQVWFIHGLWT